MKVLIACEESQVICTEARKRGHEAYSCDILDPSGGHPEWHIKGDCLPLLSGGVRFKTMDGTEHEIDGRWDLLIAHPPCTYLTVTGNRWFSDEYGVAALSRHRERMNAIEFFMQFAMCNARRIAIENPVGIMSSVYRKPDQIVHPYYFAESDGDENCERKATCLWLKNLAPLEYEIRFKPRVVEYKNGKGTDSPWHMDTIGLPADERARLRSRTFLGIAKACVDQWMGDAENETD